MKLEFSQQIFEKSSNTKFHENPSIGRRVPCTWTDRHNEANCSLFAMFLTRLKSSSNPCTDLDSPWKLKLRLPDFMTIGTWKW